MDIILKKMIDMCDIVSFDIFDTLIKRNCNNPKDIFDIVEKKYNETSEIKIKNFRSKRIISENIGRNVSKLDDICIDDIYNFIDYDERIKKELKKIELQTEIQFCQLNDNLSEIYEYCRRNKKKIICTSDMYLRKETIEEILNNNNICVDRIYVSSEFGTSKYKGGLFDIIKKDFINKKILHIGDSKRSDFINPIVHGVLAYKIPANVNKIKFYKKSSSPSLTQNIIETIINNNTPTDYFSKLGYEVFGPICLQFIVWLHEKAINLNIGDILFCARDMKMINEMYNIFYKDKAIRNHYFYVSRKSICLPYLYINDDYNSFKEMCNMCIGKITILELLDTININYANIEDAIIKTGLDVKCEYKISNLVNDRRFLELYNNYLRDYIISYGKEQYDNFIKYMNKMNLGSNKAIVDLGWNGNTQKILMSMFKSEFKGFYFGLNTKKGVLNGENTFTWIFDDTEKNYSIRIFSFKTLFEKFFSACHGSTLGYSLGNPNIGVEELHDENIERIQNSAINFIKDIEKYSDLIDYFDTKKYVDIIVKIGVNPNIYEAKMLGNIYTNNYIQRKIARPQGIIYYVTHMKILKKDLKLSEWKIGFAKNFLKIKFPYFWLYKKIIGKRGYDL